MDALLALLEGKPLAIVIDASSPDLVVLLWSRAWKELYSQVPLRRHFGKEEFQKFCIWLDRLLDDITSKGWKPSRSAALYQKMVMEGTDRTRYKARLVVHVPESSVSTEPRSTRVVVVSVENMTTVRKPKQRSSKTSLNSIPEMPLEEDGKAGIPDPSTHSSEERNSRLFGGAAIIQCQEFQERNGLSSKACSTTGGEASSSVTSSCRVFGSEGSSGGKEDFSGIDTRGGRSCTLGDSWVFVGAQLAAALAKSATWELSVAAGPTLAWPKWANQERDANGALGRVRLIVSL
mmetsp:Transcript_173475/g.556421  ORF Transcript_173475/g.556421 Transcript_173475/m.556421 type:complete len:291 (-) Transcript_173475:171-1043(-)